MKKPIKKLVTHNGSFHTDDVFAAAALSILLEAKGEAFEVIRTRDEKIIKSGDYVFDVGGIYDEKNNRFDHHQVGGAGRRQREGNIEYSSFGLVWRKFGTEICGNEKASNIIDEKLVSPIDAWDNGFDLVVNKHKKISPYFVQHVFFGMLPTWREEDHNHDEMFLKSLAIAKEILLREIIHAKDAILAEEKIIAIYKNSPDKRIIVLDKNYPYGYTLNAFPEPLFVVYPRETDNSWGVKAVREDPKTFKNRKDLPATWSGLRDLELQKISGVTDATFCHRALFLAIAKSQIGAIKLAQIAVES